MLGPKGRRLREIYKGRAPASPGLFSWGGSCLRHPCRGGGALLKRHRQLVRHSTSAISYPVWERLTVSAARAKPRISISPKRSRACPILIETTAQLAASSICGMRVALAGPTLADIDRALGLPVKSKD